VKFAGTLIVDRKSLPIEIIDISRVGACVRGDGLPERGDEVLLCAEGLQVVATVVWSDGAACGMNFHKPIALVDMDEQDLDLPNRNTLTKALAMRG
jgi:hypothetical protein